MKIIHLTTFLDFGGIESKKTKLSQWNDENDWIFTALGKGGNSELKIKSNGKRVDILNLNHKIPTFNTVWKLYKYLKKEKPDILHTAGAEANFFGFLAGKIAGVRKIVIEEIGIPNHSKIASKIFQYIYKNADFVIGESELVVQYLMKKFNANHHKTKVVHNFGVFNYDLSKIKIHTSESFRILMLSRLESVKNIDGVINVLQKLNKNFFGSVTLIIAGSGTLEEHLKKKVEFLNLENVVQFVGFIDDPYPYFLNSDLYILNSFSEGFSNSLIEAMYSKILCLSTNVGAASEIIQDYKNGFIVPVDDEDALYTKINEIKSIPISQRFKIATLGQQTIINNFTLENHISELMKIYKS